MVKEKNITALLDVAHTLIDHNVDFSLQLIGYGTDYEALQEYAYQKLTLPKERVSFVHKPPQSVIVQAYSDADLFLFSSSNDTQGLVLAEAMAGGTPVIAFDGPGQRDIIKQGENGFIVADEKEMAETIMHLSNNRKQLAALSEHAWQTAQAYQPERLSKRLVQFYRQIMDML